MSPKAKQPLTPTQSRFYVTRHAFPKTKVRDAWHKRAVWQTIDCVLNFSLRTWPGNFRVLQMVTDWWCKVIVFVCRTARLFFVWIHVGKRQSLGRVLGVSDVKITLWRHKRGRTSKYAKIIVPVCLIERRKTRVAVFEIRFANSYLFWIWKYFPILAGQVDEWQNVLPLALFS